MLDDVKPPNFRRDSFDCDYSDSDADKSVCETATGATGGVKNMHDETRDDESIYIEALQEELAQVQKLVKKV